MPSLAELPDLTGFFSYSRRDDEDSQGALSLLRKKIYREVRLQLGFKYKLWQDTAAIPQGALWEREIKRAISESVFFIPIVSPSSVASKHCRMEFEAFLAREEALGRSDLVFPLLYVGIPALENEELWRQDPLLGIIGSRQYIDWQRFRHRSLDDPEVAEKIAEFCENIVKSLRQPWISLADRRVAEEAEAQRVAEQARRDQEEKKRQQADAEARRQAEQERRAAAEAEAQRRADQERRDQEEEKRQQAEAETRRKAEQERRAAGQAEAQRIAERARREEEDKERQEAAQARQQQRGAAEQAEARRIADQERRREEDRPRQEPGMQPDWGPPRTTPSLNVVMAALGAIPLLVLVMFVLSIY